MQIMLWKNSKKVGTAKDPLRCVVEQTTGMNQNLLYGKSTRNLLQYYDLVYIEAFQRHMYYGLWFVGFVDSHLV